MAVDPTSGQLGSIALGSFGLGWLGPLSIQQARINSFTASNYGPVVPGTAITLTWSTTFATTVSISGIGVVAANGSMVVNPTVTTTYVLTASDGVNPTQTRQITIVITPVGVFVRQAQGSSTGQIISCSMQLDLGDLVVVEIGSSQTPDGALFGVVDNLGNSYSTAIQGHQLPPDSALPNDALIAWTIVTHPGAAVIEADYLSSFSRIIFAQEYRVPPDMTLAQTAHQIGGVTVSPSYFIANALGSAPYNCANSVVITFFKQGGFGFNYTSLDGDTLRGCDPGCDNGGAGTVGGAVFEAITGSPLIRNSTVKMDPIAVGQPSCLGNTTDCHGNPWPTAPFYGFGGFMNMLVAVFSTPLPRASTLTDQGAVHPGLSDTISGYAGQPDVPVSLGYLPKIGGLILVGCSSQWSGSGPQPAFTVTDAYGHTYTSVPGSRYQLGFNVAEMFYTVVTARPATGVFTVNVHTVPFNGQKCMSIAEHDVNNLNTAMIQSAIQAFGSTGTGQQTLQTVPFTVAARSLVAGFGTAQRFTSASTPWIASGGFAIEPGASWDKGQVDAAPLANTAREGTGDWFHQYLQAGTYTGQTITDSGAQALADSAIIVAYVPAPVIPSGGPVTLTCAVNGGTGVVGVFYSAQVIASGGTPPYSNYHLVQGSGPLPPGLTLHSTTGVIDGVPTLAGTYTFTIEVTDSLGATATVTCTIRIQSSFPIACPGVSTGNVGVFFSSQLTASGGTPPYTWGLVAGTLPPGLTLATSGLISGIPTTAGSYTYTVQATDSSGTPLQAQQVCMIIIGPALCYLPLWRQDEFAMDAFLTSWAQAPATRPRAFSVSVTPPVSLQVAPVPLNAGVLDLCVVEGGPVLAPSDLTTLLSVADDLAWAVVFGALSDLLSQDGQSRDPSRAAYCESRYQQAIEVARQLPSGLTTQVNNIPMNTGSVFDLDAFLPNWQCIQGRPRFGGYAGRNLLALGPVPDGVYGITADIVPNIPVPANDVDFIQAGREDIAYILDYAQHLASFKMGGAEFTNTMKLLKNFFAGAVMRNSRLKGTTIDKFDLDVPGSKQQLQYERTEGGSSMPTTNEGS